MSESLYTEALLSRVAEGIDDADASRLINSDWMVKFLSHPRLEDTSWSFEGYEYQIDIVNSKAPKRSIIKCSQVGLSEIAVAIILTILSREARVRAIYTLPTKKFSEVFMSDRVNSAIENSEYVSGMIVPEINNLTVKKFSNGSYLYADGTEGSRSGISIPAPYLFKDEVDFSNLKMLNRLSSRQASWAEEDTIDMQFSTPTLPGYGISEAYSKSSKGTYACRCAKCNTISPLDFFTDVVVPGYDHPLIEWTASDLLNPKYKVDEAYLKCPKCGNAVSGDNLADSSMREWVHEHPDRVGHHDGFRVQPFDVYTTNPPARTLRQVDDYDDKQEWVNFRVGAAYVDATSRIAPPQEVSINDIPRGGRYFLGADVGKTSWIVVGCVVNGRIYLVRQEQVSNVLDPVTKRSSVAERIAVLKAQYHIRRIVVDGMPDLTLSATIIDMFPEGYIARYVQTAPEPGAFCKFKDSGEVVIMRTEGFNLLATKTGMSSVLQVACDETRIFNAHIKAMAKVFDKGKAIWKNTGDDHYAHAFLYMMVASGSLSIRRRGDGLSPENLFTGGITSVKLPSTRKQQFNPIPKLY